MRNIKSDIENVVYLNLSRYDLRSKAFGALKSVLRLVYKYAYNQYWVNDNIYERMDFTKYEGMIADDIDVAKRVHSSETLRCILDEIHSHQRTKPNYIPAYALEMQILCGSRRGEIPPLRLTDIHEDYIEFCQEQITVKKFNNVPEYCKIVAHTKTFKDRYFVRYDALNEFLDRLLAIHEK